MKRVYRMVVGKILVFAGGILIVLAVSGCGDPTVAEFKANQRRMGDICQQELAHGLSSLTPTTQTSTFRPAP